MAVQSRRWASVREIAKHIGVSKETVYRWVDNRGMPAHRVGRLMKFQVDEVDEWIRRGGANDTAGDAQGTSVPGSNRQAWLRRFAEAVVTIENLRASSDHRAVQGEIQGLLSRLLALRAMVEILPEERTRQLTDLQGLNALEDAVRATLTTDTPAVRQECFLAASDTLERVAAQIHGSGDQP